MPFEIKFEFDAREPPVLEFPPVTVRKVCGDPYDGDYEATPSRETQVFPTAGKTMINDFVVNPIPSNYGLISYNGFELTVS